MKTCFAVAALLALAALPQTALAQNDLNSGNSRYPGCKNDLAEKRDGRLEFDSGICMGIVETYLYLARVLPEELRICQPSEVTKRQGVRVVVAYMDRNPAQLHEPFKILANRALREAWPCK